MFPRRPDYLLKVRGMSMRDAGIMDGDLLAVQKAQRRQERPDRRRAAGRRRHRQAPPPHQAGIELIPENPDFQTIHGAAGRRHDFELEGLAVGPDPQHHADVRRAGAWPSRRPRRRQRRPSARRSSSCPTSARRSPPTCGCIGIHHPARAGARDAFVLYQALCSATGKRQDPCVLDTFMAATDFMRGAAPAPWWDYTAQRKQLFGPSEQAGRLAEPAPGLPGPNWRLLRPLFRLYHGR